jgi:hypothetical protein
MASKMDIRDKLGYILYSLATDWRVFVVVDSSFAASIPIMPLRLSYPLPF